MSEEEVFEAEADSLDETGTGKFRHKSRRWWSQVAVVESTATNVKMRTG